MSMRRTRMSPYERGLNDQIDPLKQSLSEASALGSAFAEVLTRILNADGVIARAEAERDARDLLAGRPGRSAEALLERLDAIEDALHTWMENNTSETELRLLERIEAVRASLRGAPNKEKVMNEQNVSIGRIVHYRLSADDAAAINRRRTDGGSIAQRMKASTPAVEGGAPDIAAWPYGAQAHIGNEAREGDTFPMLITKVWGSTPTSAVNGQVFLDGNDVLWATSVCVGEGPRTFSWPVR